MFHTTKRNRKKKFNMLNMDKKKIPFSKYSHRIRIELQFLISQIFKQFFFLINTLSEVISMKIWKAWVPKIQA